jgi:hypothetical protein
LASTSTQRVLIAFISGTARLESDLPTYETAESRFSELDYFEPWDAVENIVTPLSNILNIFSLSGVLATIIMEHKSMILFTFFQLVPSLLLNSNNSLTGGES